MIRDDLCDKGQTRIYKYSDSLSLNGHTFISQLVRPYKLGFFFAFFVDPDQPSEELVNRESRDRVDRESE